MGRMSANNAATTINMGAGLGIADTLITVTDGSVFPAVGLVTDELYALATIDDGTNIEIVRVRSVAGNDLTVERGAESSTAAAFADGAAIEMRTTAEIQDEGPKTERYTITGGLRNTSGARTVDVQTRATIASHVMAANDSVAIGQEIAVTGATEIAIGANITGAGTNPNSSIRIGSVLDDSGTANSIFIGREHSNGGVRNIAVGQDLDSLSPHGSDNIQAGFQHDRAPSASSNIGLGQDQFMNGADGSILLGRNLEDYGGVPGAITGDLGVLILGASPAHQRGDVTSSHDRLRYSGAPFEYVGPSIDLTSTGDFNVTPDLPDSTSFVPGPGHSGYAYFIDECGIIITYQAMDPFKNPPNITGQPTIAFGFGGAGEELLASVATVGLAAVNNRQRFTTLLTDNGSISIGYRITTGATGANAWGRFYVKGMVVGF